MHAQFGWLHDNEFVKNYAFYFYFGVNENLVGNLHQHVGRGVRPNYNEPLTIYVNTAAKGDNVYQCCEHHGCEVEIINLLQKQILLHFNITMEILKVQPTPIFDLPSIRSTIPVHYDYAGTSFRTESCVILNKLTKINIKSGGDAGKNQS